MELEVYRSGRRIKSLAFGERVLRIGQLAACDLQLRGRGVAGLHAQIEPDPEGDGFRISRIGSSRMWINGGPASLAKLRQGDCLEIGCFKIVVRSEWDIDSEADITEDLV